jgi:hypothetical protein
MLIRYGSLLGVVGHPRQVLDLFFCPALIEIDDPQACHRLADYLRVEMDLACFLDTEQPPDALWVRSRLPVVFGYRPLQVADGRTFLLDHGFVAVLDAGGAHPTVIPFACTDNAAEECHLVMSRSEEGGLRARVAQCFWELLAVAGADGQDFRAEGLEWLHSWDPFACDEPEELLTEVGRAGGRYYSNATAWDCDLDPNYGRPDWSPGQWQCRWSRPIRRCRKCS